MKQLITILATAIICSTASAQTDTTKTNKNDTIRIGGIIIVKNGKNKNSKDVNINMGRKYNERKRNSNVSTNWWIFDFGSANYTDKTNYATTGSYLVNRPGYPALDKNDFKLRANKSK